MNAKEQLTEMRTQRNELHRADPEYCYDCGAELKDDEIGKFELRVHDSSPHSYHIGWLCSKCYADRVAEDEVIVRE